MAERLAFVAPQDPAWRTALAETSHDVYHLPAYATLSVWSDGGTPGAFVYRDRDGTIVWPLLVRQLPPELDQTAGRRDATGVYGYGSPAATPGMPRAALAAGFAAIAKAAADMGLVTAFSRLHPLLPLALDPPPKGVQIVSSGVTVGMDLRLDRARLWAGLRKGHRSDIRRLEGRGFRVCWDVWSRLDEFVAMYYQTMDRVQARAYYRFRREYFDALAESLAGHVHLGLACDPEGRAVAGALFFHCNGIVQYHLSASLPEGLRWGAGKLLLWEAAQRAAAAGARVLHLGGGYGGEEDSLLRFKLGFATDRYTFSTLRFVADPDAYLELCRRAGRAPTGTGPDADGFFPSYRSAATREAAP